ncbi:MAG: SH3 domain-containing protein [Bacillota bacterium]|nr:SH3 domain-containing protein [Bacillota bacterium]
MKKRFIGLFLAILMLASVAVVPASAAACKGAVTTTALNLRSQANTSSGIITTMPGGAGVLVLSTSNGWCKVIYNGTEGYASQQYLQSKDTVSGSFGVGTITGNSVRMRSGANTSSNILGEYNKGTQMNVTGVSGNWFAVSCNGKSGYVSMDYMSVAAKSTQTANPEPTPSAAPAETSGGAYTGKIIGTSVRMRSGPGTSYDTLGYYSNGVSMSVCGSTNGWYKVIYNGKTGYVSGSYMHITPKENYSTIKDGSVNGSSVRLRMGPSSDDFSVVQSCTKGAKLKISGVYGDWYEVSLNGTYGYMNKSYVAVGTAATETSVPAAEQSLDGIGTITANGVRVRSGPGTSYSTVGYYNKGTQMTITGKSGNWYAVTYNGLKGYVSADYMTRGAVNSQADQIVATAKQYIGVPYVWGGTSPKGFDCSGLIYYVYGQYGYSLQRRASLQYAYNGTSVSKSNLQPGDLVFFSDDVDPIGHVGMYIGNGQFIHASSGKGCVTISNLSTTYYAQHYTGAKRIVG